MDPHHVVQEEGEGVVAVEALTGRRGVLLECVYRRKAIDADQAHALGLGDSHGFAAGNPAVSDTQSERFGGEDLQCNHCVRIGMPAEEYVGTGELGVVARTTAYELITTR